MARKIKTLDEVQAMLKKAEGFARDVLRDPDKADQFASMGPEEYAGKRGIEIRSLARNKPIERTNVMTKADVESLLDDVDALLEDALAGCGKTRQNPVKHVTEEMFWTSN